MRVCCDIETNSLINPTKIWVIVCKDIDTGERHVFREVQTGSGVTEEQRRFLRFAQDVTLWIGHNWLEFDYPVLHRLIGLDIPSVETRSVDTLIISRLVNFSRSGTVDNNQVRGDPTGLSHAADVVAAYKGHSIESYGTEFGLPKIAWSDYTKYTLELEEYCVRDVDICHRIYLKYRSIIDDPLWARSIALEHQFQRVVNSLHDNGFGFDIAKANKLLAGVTKDLESLDASIKSSFPDKEVVVKEVIPRATKFGTISKTSIPRSMWHRISEFTVGVPIVVTKTQQFNPASHKQLIEVLTEAGWRPTEKTQTHVDVERELRHNKTEELQIKLKHLQKFGWKINEANLSSLPADSPSPAKLLAKRILLESRRRTLTEWLGLVSAVDGRIHGKFVGIGAWTHRMAHQAPNTANIPNEFDTQGKKKLLGKEMRSLWCAPRNRLLVGVDAEGIQLRIFAHLIDDAEFTDALVKGKKSDKTDPHSLNQRILGDVCKTRAAAKRFIYALLLGAGLQKLTAILECSEAQCREALDRLLRRYSGWERLRERDIPRDAKRGYLIGLDGRKITIPGQSVSERKHLAMSGYLQSGEAIVMKLATLKWMQEIEDEFEGRSKGASPIKSLQASPSKRIQIVNFVHDEWQTETPNDMAVALRVAEIQSRALREVGKELGLRCPLEGSYFNEDLHDYTIGSRWSVTH